MKRPSSITTCYGDRGFTKLYSGERVRKDHIRVQACGDLDELVSVLGLARAFCKSTKPRRDLEMLQRTLFGIGSEVACTARVRARRVVKIARDDLIELDRLCAFWDGKSGVRDFVLPGKTPAGAFLDYARAVARRCERRLVTLHRRGLLRNTWALAWINRLSDLLWLMSRAADGKSTLLRSPQKMS